MLTPTPHQQEAIEFIRTRLSQGNTLVAIKGLAGTGKSSLIPALRKALPLDTHVTAPTNRATAVLKHKGICDATTVHAQCLIPVFTPEYVAAESWCALVAPLAEGDTLPEPPVLIRLAGVPLPLLRERCARYDSLTVLNSLGIQAMDYLVGFGPKAPQPGILIIDEASMVGQEILSLAQKVYRRIVLIGDHGQLPPVKDVSILEQTEGYELSEIHRQASESSIVRFAYAARRGLPVWRAPTAEYAPEVARYSHLHATTLLHAPLIVWMNKTRLAVTEIVRATLGYNDESLVEGEPVVCRSNDKRLRILGLCNNALFSIKKVHGPREVTLCDTTTGDEIDRPVHLHMEETDGDFIAPGAVPFRYGYAITAHTAQGSEWPSVYLSLPDLNRYANMVGRTGELDALARWAYTAATRAKFHLGLVATHEFC